MIIGLADRSVQSRSGSLDPTFDGDGKVTTDFAGSTDAASDVAMEEDGKIVAAGLGFVFAVSFGLARYNPDGSLDQVAGLTRMARRRREVPGKRTLMVRPGPALGGRHHA